MANIVQPGVRVESSLGCDPAERLGELVGIVSATITSVANEIEVDPLLSLHAPLQLLLAVGAETLDEGGIKGDGTPGAVRLGSKELRGPPAFGLLERAGYPHGAALQVDALPRKAEHF